jgi:Kef-type K+ transport system membrane component KefB
MLLDGRLDQMPRDAEWLPSMWVLAMAAVIVVGRLLAPLVRAVGQPPVIGEVIAGIVLGPSLLGRLSPDAFRYILPADVAPFLGIVAQLGVILYMFLVGLELNPDVVRQRVHAAVTTSLASILLPFALGWVLAVYLYPRFATSDVAFTHFALFVGVAMSITAFPVLARILTDRGMSRTELGVLALSCAAVDDITAWCLLAFIVGVVQATAGGGVVPVILMTLAFIAFMFTVVRPIAVRLARLVEDRDPPQATIAMVVVAVLAAALATEGIGVHAIFGAFLLGTVIPHDSRLARAIKGRFEDLVTILLLPAFFAFTGMRTQIDLVTGSEWLVVALIIGVATAGKFGGTLLGARVSGLSWLSAASLGILMNTRGLMELIVLNLGFDLGVISPKLYTMMVLMALATTIATTPVLRLTMHATDR